MNTTGEAVWDRRRLHPRLSEFRIGRERGARHPESGNAVGGNSILARTVTLMEVRHESAFRDTDLIVAKPETFWARSK